MKAKNSTEDSFQTYQENSLGNIFRRRHRDSPKISDIFWRFIPEISKRILQNSSEISYSEDFERIPRRLVQMISEELIGILRILILNIFQEIFGTLQWLIPKNSEYSVGILWKLYSEDIRIIPKSSELFGYLFRKFLNKSSWFSEGFCLKEDLTKDVRRFCLNSSQTLLYPDSSKVFRTLRGIMQRIQTSSLEFFREILRKFLKKSWTSFE